MTGKDFQPVALMLVQMMSGTALATSTADTGADSSARNDAFVLSGFGSLIAGRSFGKCQPADTWMIQDKGACTRYIADWGHDGVYTPRLSLQAESVIGLQLDKRFTDQLSATVQTTSRPIRGQQLELAWAYLSYDITPDLSLQVGRQRLPLFYYSNTQDVGYSYDTIGLSTAVYGWEVSEFNGVALGYHFGVGNGAYRIVGLAGNSRTADAPYARLFWPHRQDIAWSHIRGVNLEFNHQWWSGRLSYSRSRYSQVDGVTGPTLLITGDHAHEQVFKGAALNLELDDWTLRTEAGTAARLGIGVRARFQLVSVSYRLGKFTPTLAYGTYAETTPFKGLVTPARLKVMTATVRYDFQKNMAFKIQFNRYIDYARPQFQGTASMVNFGLNFVF